MAPSNRCNDPYGTLVPEGEYRAVFLRRETGFPHGRTVWFCHFQITEEGPHHGKRLLRFWNEPRKDFLPRTHNLFLDYVQLGGGRLPPGRLTPEQFLKGCEVAVEVVTVKSKHDGRRVIELPKGLWYSKIDRLVRFTAGCPPCMSFRTRR